MVVYADWQLVESQIDHILNRAVPGAFGNVGDTGASSDKRYSDQAVTEARRLSAARVLEAVGANVSHPYWSELATNVDVTHRQKIPAYFGEIGIPIIAPFTIATTVRILDNAVKASGDNTVQFNVGTGGFSNTDLGKRLVIEFKDDITDATKTLIDAVIESIVSADSVTVTTYAVGGKDTAIAPVFQRTIIATVIDNAGQALADTDYDTAHPADPDEIDSYRRDTKGTFSDLFGMANTYAHNEQTADGCPSPLAGKYSTSNSIIRFTGAACRIPMIAKPSAPLVLSNGNSNQLIINNISCTIGQLSCQSAGKFPDWVDGLQLTVVAGGTVINAATVTWQSLSALALSLAATGTTTVGVGTFTGTISADAALRRMLDLYIPVDLASLLVKLALPLLVKEGDNLYRIALYLGQEGERELMGIRQGGIKAAPVDPKKLIQMSQRLT